METPLYRSLQWARKNGDVDTMQRLRLQLLPLSIRERIVLEKVTPETSCSTDYLIAVRRAIRDVVGKDAPA